MTGLSLRCGDCGSALRSVEEAQQHAELTGHSNFDESTEAVLNLVCSSCGKPCRSQTEIDLHTKRTGHADFVDKTEETAKPIDLESKPQPMDVDAQAAAEGPMVSPEVNEDLLEQLEGMGFSKNKSIRAIYYGKAQDLEAAVNWIVEHEGDADIDTELLVPAAQVKTPLSAEEAKARAKELVERAKKKKEEEEKRMEREREKERIRVGRELLEAKRKEEENERKRILMYRKAEKEEEKRAREKIKQKIAEDKAERRRKLGLPPEDPATNDKVDSPPPPATIQATTEEKKPSAKPASKSDELRSCLRSMKQAHKDDDAKVKKAFQTLQTYIGNVGRNPQEEKFRKIRVSNAVFQERVGSLGGVKFLEACGFEMDESKEFLVLAKDKVDVSLLRAADHELNSAISNPFFGVL